MPTRISVSTLEDGTQHVDTAEVPAEDKRRLDAMVDGVESAARKRLKRLEAQRKPELIPFEVEGESLFIRRLNYQELIDLALTVSRNGVNVLNVNNEEGVRSVTIAMLSACVCCEDGEPYFKHEDIEESLDTADDANFVSALSARCSEVNPDIFKTPKND